MKVYDISASAKPSRGRFPGYADLGMREQDARLLRPIGCGRPFPREWKPVQFFINTPLLPRADFYGITRALIVNERVVELAGEPLEMSGELLPVTIEGESGSFYIYNITNCINVLDPGKTVWRGLGSLKEYREPARPAFIAERFGEESIFKFPEDGAVGIYCLERTGDADDGEFKALVERHALTGLEFKPVWSDDS